MIVLSSSFAVAIMLVSIFALGKLLLRWYNPQTFYVYKPEKMIVYLEKRYTIDIPNSAREIKAAKTGQSWDRVSEFILKFTAKTSEVNKFLETAVGTVLDPYNSRQDDRFDPYKSAPQWWTKPIKKGKMGRIYVEDTFVKDMRSTIYVYIDNLDEENNVVYIQGIYRSELDR